MEEREMTEAEHDLVGAIASLAQREISVDKIGNEWRNADYDARARQEVIEPLRRVVKALVLEALREAGAER